jgi:hypothetical protein
MDDTELLKYYYRQGKRVHGPFTLLALKAMAKAGTLLPHEMLRQEDKSDQNWFEARKLKGLFDKERPAESGTNLDETSIPLGSVLQLLVLGVFVLALLSLTLTLLVSADALTVSQYVRAVLGLIVVCLISYFILGAFLPSSSGEGASVARKGFWTNLLAFKNRVEEMDIPGLSDANIKKAKIALGCGSLLLPVIIIIGCCGGFFNSSAPVHVSSPSSTEINDVTKIHDGHDWQRASDEVRRKHVDEAAKKTGQNPDDLKDSLDAVYGTHTK